MRILACLVPLAALAAAPPARPDTPAKLATDTANPCAGVRSTTAATTGKRPLVHLLSQEPGARQEVAVERFVGRCEMPIIVREDVGGNSPAVSSDRPAVEDLLRR